MKILLLDNYDSFTWNLFHYAEQFCDDVTVKRNDKIAIEEIGIYSHIILSPGPGLPKDAGIMPELLSNYSSSKKILGICLGMQAIAEYFGGELFNLSKVKHGVQEDCDLVEEGNPLFSGIKSPVKTGHYHSWAVSQTNFPEELTITARNREKVIMGFRHKSLPIYGLQFHPESLLTPDGLKMIENWIRNC